MLVDGLAVQAKGKMGPDDLDVNLSAPKLEASPERASGQPAELLVNLRGADRKAAVALKLSGNGRLRQSTQDLGAAAECGR